MRLSVITEINSLQKQLMGYNMLMSYRYCHLCVKAEPAALLSIEETVAGMDYKIEDMAQVLMHEGEEEDIMDLFPIRSEYMEIIIKGVMRSHPEFKLELKNRHEYEEDEQEKNDSIDNKYIRLTMPEVNKDRRDLLLNIVDVQDKLCQSNMERVQTKASAVVIQKTLNDSAADIDEAKKALQDVIDEGKQMRETLTNEKKEEIEKAYQRYLENGGTDNPSQPTKGGGGSSADSGGASSADNPGQASASQGASDHSSARNGATTDGQVTTGGQSAMGGNTNAADSVASTDSPDEEGDNDVLSILGQSLKLDM